MIATLTTKTKCCSSEDRKNVLKRKRNPCLNWPKQTPCGLEEKWEVWACSHPSILYPPLVLSKDLEIEIIRNQLSHECHCNMISYQQYHAFWSVERVWENFKLWRKCSNAYRDLDRMESFKKLRVFAIKGRRRIIASWRCDWWNVYIITKVLKKG